MECQNRLRFIHIPKTAGQYMTSLVYKNNLGRANGGHNKFKPNLLEKNEIAFTNIRHPYSWYKSLYQYWKRRLREGNKPYNPMAEIANLDWLEFLDIILDREKFRQYVEENIGDKKSDPIPYVRQASNLHLGFKNCPLDIGFFSYVTLYIVFDDKVYDLTVDEIISDKENLLLVSNVLKQENLQEDFLALLKKYRITRKNLVGFHDVVNKLRLL